MVSDTVTASLTAHLIASVFSFRAFHFWKDLWILNKALHFAVYNVRSRVSYAPTFLAQIFRKKLFPFNVFIQLLKPIIVFQAIIFHTDIIIAF